MCGIAATGGGAPPDTPTLEAMAARLAHRGPDGALAGPAAIRKSTQSAGTRAQLARGMVRLRCRADGVSDFSHCSLQRLNTLHELRDHDSC